MASSFVNERLAIDALRVDDGPGWGRVIVANLARGSLILALGLALWGVVPVVIGWHTTTVMTGSMSPAIVLGDVVVAKPVAESELALGQVVLVRDPDHAGRLRLHRIVEFTEIGELILRGDANDMNDSTPVERDGVVGVGLIRVPLAGLPALFVHERDWWGLSLVVAALGALVWLSTVDRGRLGSGRDDEPAGVAIVFVSGLVALSLVAVVLAPPAGARFAATTANTGNSLATLGYYTCDAAILASSPYLYFRFDETSGTTATDSSGNGRNGQYRGGVTLGQAKACARDTGSAVRLNGTSGFVSMASATAVSAPSRYTISMWFKTSSTTGGRLIGFGNLRNTLSTRFDRHIYITTTGLLRFGTYNSSTVWTIASTASGYNDGNWHHVAGVQAASGMAFYVDGQLQGTNTSATTDPYTGYWRVGWDNLAGWTGGATAYINATVDIAVVYTTPLTASQIATQYAAGK